MRDIFLQSTTQEQLINDLYSFHPDFIIEEVSVDGTVIKTIKQADKEFAIDYIGVLAKPGTGSWDADGKEISPVEFYPGVHCNLRLSGGLTNLFDSFVSADTKLLTPKTPCRVFA